MLNIPSKYLRILRKIALLATVGALVTFIVIGFGRGWDGQMSGIQFIMLMVGLVGFSLFAFTMNALQKQAESSGNSEAETIEISEKSPSFKVEKGTRSLIKAIGAWITLGVSLYAVGMSIFFLGMFAYTEITGYTGKLSLAGRLVGILFVTIIGVVGLLAARWGWKNRKTTWKFSVVDKQLHLARAEALINWVVGLAIISAFFTVKNTWDFFTQGEDVSFTSGLYVLIVVSMLFVMLVGVVNRSRVAATIFTLYQIGGVIYYLPDGQPPPMYVFISVFMSVFLVFGTVAIYFRHMLLNELEGVN